MNPSRFTAILNEKFSVRCHQHPLKASMDNHVGSYHRIRWIQKISVLLALFLFKKSLIENAAMAKMYCHAYPLGTGELISESGFFPLSAPVS
jgi:hypothetical protein